MKIVSLVALLIFVWQLPVIATEKCWLSSPPRHFEKNFDLLDPSETGETRCFDKSTLVVLESNGKIDVMVRAYTKVSAKSKLELAKQGVSCTYDYQDIILSCPKNNFNGCVKYLLSWVYLNDKYEPQVTMDAKLFASIGMKYPITTPMSESDTKDYVYLVLTDLAKHIPPPAKPKDPLPTKTVPKTPKTYSADDEISTQ